MNLFRTIAIYLYLPIVTIPLSIGCIVSALLGDRNGAIWWRISRFWGHWLVRTTGVTELKTVREEILESLQSAILMSNHRSHLDPPVLIAISRKNPLRFLTKHTLFYFPVFGVALRLMGHIFINHSNKEKAFKSLEKAAMSIAGGKIVFIFPEGRRSIADGMLPFKNGGFMLAIDSGVPIIPAAVAGTGEVLPPGWLCMETGPAVVVFGEPIETKGYDENKRDELKKIVYNAITELYHEAVTVRQDMIKT